MGAVDLGGTQLFDGEGGLFARFVLIDGLGEEVGASLDAGRGHVGGVVLEILVDAQHALGGAAVAHAHEGELHPGLGHGSPVDEALVLGHVDAPARAQLVALVVRQLVAIAHQALPVIGAHIGLGLRRGFLLGF